MDKENTTEQIKEDVSKLVKDIAGIREDLSSKGTAKLEEMKSQAEEKMSEAKERVVTKAKKVDEYAHEKPWVAAGLAAAIGALVGSLVAWSKRDRKR